MTWMDAVVLGRSTVAWMTMRWSSPFTALKSKRQDVTPKTELTGPVGDTPSISSR